MIRRTLTFGLCLLTAMVATTCIAANEYWVTRGSFRSQGEADAARRQADQLLSDSFSVGRAELDSGRWYRVMAGPYPTEETTQDMVTAARSRGIDSPWVLVRTSSADQANADEDSDLLGREPASADEVDGNDFRIDMPPGSTPIDIPGFNAPIRSDAEVEHKLVDKAPPGYRLNQLHRN